MHPCDLIEADYQKLLEYIIEEIQASVNVKEYKEYCVSWNKKKAMNCTHHPLLRCSILKQHMLKQLNKVYPIHLSHCKQKSPEYYYEKDTDNPDHIALPYMSRFNARKYYYSAFFHESGHAAFSFTRLKLHRNIESEEEISVELFSLTLCFLLGLNVWKDSLGYITNHAYGSKKEKEDHILYIQSSEDWNRITKNTLRLIRYFDFQSLT